jgi:predicted small metal-binding protein
MAKVLTCREVGLDCDFVARGNSEKEILSQAAAHAQKDHGFTSIPPAVIERSRPPFVTNSHSRARRVGETPSER